MTPVTPELFQKITKLSKGRRMQALKLLGQQEFDHCAEDPLYWLDASQHAGVPYVYTLDAHPMYKCKLCDDGATYNMNKRKGHLELRHEIKYADDWNAELKANFTELPTTRSFTIMDYMRPIIHLWQHEQLLAIEKSRDMIATWLIVVLYTWDTLFHAGRQNIFQSDDAQKTLELVKRSAFVYNQQPWWLKKHKAAFQSGNTRSGILSVPSLNSEILGFPQGPDQIRQYHPTGIYIDEAAYQVMAEDAFAAVKPAIQNGGRCTMVSSANPGFFYHVCRDTTHL